MWHRRRRRLQRPDEPASSGGPERGILLQVRGTQGIVLTPSGEFRRVPLPWADARVGDEIPVPSPADRARTPGTQLRWVRWATRGYPAAARPGPAFGGYPAGAPAARRLTGAGLRRAAALGLAMLLVLMVPLGIVATTRYIAAAPLAFVTVDINPSVELAVNAATRVVGSTPLNADGARLLEHLGAQGLTGLVAESAVARLAEAAVALNYLAEGDAEHLILVSVTPAGTAAAAGILRSRLGALERRLEAARPLQAVLDKAGVPAVVETIVVAPEVRNEAQAMQLSPGKLVVVLTALAGEDPGSAVTGPDAPAVQAVADNLLAGIKAAGKDPAAVLAQTKERGKRPDDQKALLQAEKETLNTLRRSLDERRGREGHNEGRDRSGISGRSRGAEPAGASAGAGGGASAGAGPGGPGGIGGGPGSAGQPAAAGATSPAASSEPGGSSQAPAAGPDPAPSHDQDQGGRGLTEGPPEEGASGSAGPPGAAPGTGRDADGRGRDRVEEPGRGRGREDDTAEVMHRPPSGDRPPGRGPLKDREVDKERNGSRRDGGGGSRPGPVVPPA